MEYLGLAGKGAHCELYLAHNAHGSIVDKIESMARAKGIPVRRADRAFFAALGPSSRHQGAAIRVPGAESRPHADCAGLVASAASRRGVIVLLDGITDPRNAGAIIRTAEALGCEGVVLPRSRSVPLNATVIKASCGATAHLPVVEASNAASFLREAKKGGLWIVGTAQEGGRAPSEAREFRPAVIVIGSEGDGMRRLTGEYCDVLLTIPMKGRISSLNASVAAGIVLYEALR